MNLTDDEIRIQVAEAMGITGIWPGGHWNGQDVSGKLVPVPSYLEDLNACAEFESNLPDAEYITYCQHLNQEWLKENTPPAGRVGLLRSACATARQRCLAFLKVKGILP